MSSLPEELPSPFLALEIELLAGSPGMPGSDRELASDEPMESAEGAALGEDMKEWEWEADREAWEVEAAPELEDEAEVEHEDWEYERLDLGHELEEEEELAAGPYELAYVEPEDEAAAGSGIDLGSRIADLARREWEAWGRGTRKETDPAMRETLLGYWETVLSRSAAERAVRDRRFWSAVFVSYLLRHAGAGTAFTYAAAHYLYVAAAKRARRSNDTAKFRAFGITEVKPEIGDIVCRDRHTKPGQCGGTTYDNVDDGRYHPTHCDIVTEVTSNSISMIGGNVDHSVKARTIRLDAGGLVIPGQGSCAYFAILKSPGQRPATAAPIAAPTATPAESSGVLSSLPRQLADTVRRGAITLQVALAVLSGQRDVNLLTNMLFYARHPEVPSGTRIQPHQRALADDWRRIRDQVIVPLLKTMGVTSASNGGSSAALAPDAVQRVERWAALSDPVAKANGVDPNFVLGLIAAESGGDPKLKAGSGYLGLMQAAHIKDDPTLTQLEPDVSVATGVRKLVQFRTALDRILQKHGRSFASLARLDGLKMLALCYNAGPVTVAKALDYAAAAGTPDAWLAEEHYQRALLFTGAFSTGQAAGTCLSGQDAGVRRSAILAAEADRRRWRFANRCKDWRTCPDPPPWPDVSSQLAAFTRCAIAFKHRNTPRYWDKIQQYLTHFDQRHRT